jgi:hypothetical protein
MIITMDDKNEFVTKKMFHEGMEHLEAKIDAKIDALALMTQQEFAAVWGKLEEIDDRLDGIATKHDLFQFEARIMAAIGDIAAELKNHNVRILALERTVKP